MKGSAGVAIFAAILLTPQAPAAHEIPSDVRIQAFLKPEGERLRLIVRLPMAALAEVEWPADGVRLDTARAEPVMREAAATWAADRLEIYEGERRLGAPRVVAVRASPATDASFDSYEAALAHVRAGAGDDELAVAQALLDVLFEYAIESERSLFAIDPKLQMGALRTVTVLRVLPADEAERAFQFHDDPGLVRLDPRWFQAASRFVVDGFFHILGGVDHLLFLLCLIVPFRSFAGLVPIVTAFTVAHSVTLVASAYGMAPDVLWFPPLVETLIAASIVYMALENIVAPALARRSVVTFAFGLVHGFGFSFALRDSLQFAGDHLLTSLLSFNVGVELGQLLVLAVAIPALELLFRAGVAERIGTILLSAFVAHTGWHWMIDRGAALWMYQFQWPVLDAAFFALILRWLMIAVALAALGWLLTLVRKQRTPARQLESGANE